MPLYADVSFDKAGISVQNIRGSLCGVSTPGSLKISDQGIEMNVRPSAVNQELEPAILCLSEKKTDITGTFSLTGHLHSRGESEALIPLFKGISSSQPPGDWFSIMRSWQESSRSSMLQKSSGAGSPIFSGGISLRFDHHRRKYPRRQARAEGINHRRPYRRSHRQW